MELFQERVIRIFQAEKMEVVRKVAKTPKVWYVSGKCPDGTEAHMAGGRNEAERMNCCQNK